MIISIEVPKYSTLPYPDGWFAACFSSELPPGSVLSRKLCDRDVIVFRTEAGVPAIVDAHCPHMGAHMGVGGRVEGEAIRCPFHGFRFAPDGACVSTPYGSKIRQSARSPPGRCARRTSSRCSTNCTPTGPISRYAMSRLGFGPSRRARTRSRFRIHVHGLGFSHVECHVEDRDIRLRYWVLCTPRDDKCELRGAASVKLLEHPSQVNLALGLLPRALATRGALSQVVPAILRTATGGPFLKVAGRREHPDRDAIVVHGRALAPGDRLAQCDRRLGGRAGRPCSLATRPSTLRITRRSP
jgi:nitrite reductase/ring-hydroxylating ferredoxin subunit